MCAGGSANIVLFGNWTNDGTFSAGTSTVVLTNTAAASIMGATTFNTLTVNELDSDTAITLNSAIPNNTFSNDGYGASMGVQIHGVANTNAANGDAVTVSGG